MKATACVTGLAAQDGPTTTTLVTDAQAGANRAAIPLALALLPLHHPEDNARSGAISHVESVAI